MRTIVVSMAALALAGCPGEDFANQDASAIDASGDGGAQVDAPFGTPDAPFGSPDAAGPDAAPRVCTTPVSYGDFGAMTGPGQFTDESVTIRDFPVPEDGNRFVIFLNEGRGIFPGAITTGTFDLDPGLDINTCGACVYLATYHPDGFFQAAYTNGTGTITISQVPSVAGETIEVVVNNVTLAAYNQDPGCLTTVTSMSFSGPAQ